VQNLPVAKLAWLHGSELSVLGKTLMSLKHKRAMRVGRLVMLPQTHMKGRLMRGMKKWGFLGPA
jgi:hypothetical protein